MQQYSHDYTIVAEAQNVLFLALEALRNDHTYEAKRGIMKARELLQQYLSRDNMVPDSDVSDGWVRHLEAQAELEALREIVRHYQNTQRAMNAVSAQVVRHSEKIERERDELKCQNQALRAKVERHGQIDSRYLEQVKDGADPSNPLYGKVAVLSGTFEQIHMERDQVAEAIQRLGAKLNRTVSATMRVFVAGDRVGPAKFKQVEALRADGHDIRIISQMEFKEICNKYLK